MSDSGTISATVEVPAVRVILADDIVDSRMLLRSMLDCVTGVEVVGEAADERQAVDTATATGADAVFLDPAMPVMDGLRAATAIRADRPDVKIISYSGGDRASTGVTGVAAGADEYLPKAFTVEQLLAQLRRVFPGRALAEKPRTGGRPPPQMEQLTGAGNRPGMANPFGYSGTGPCWTLSWRAC